MPDAGDMANRCVAGSSSPTMEGPPSVRDETGEIDSLGLKDIAMTSKLNLEIRPDHVEGRFKWDAEPSCSCGRLKGAFQERFFFVANMVEGNNSMVYMMPVDSHGHLARSGGVQIYNCPWCGDKIKVRKSRV
jgi:hypothetical protein